MPNSTKGPDAPGQHATPSSASHVATAPIPPPRLEPQPVLGRPIVFRSSRRKKRRDGRKRYSRGTRRTQRFLHGLSRAAFRMANSVAVGLETYTERTDKSMRRRRDGMARDFLRNASRGFADAAEEFGKAPEEVAWRVSTKNVRRAFRFLTPIRIS